MASLAEQERQDLLDLAETLTPEQWAAPSLCAGWSVHDVVAHVISFEGMPLARIPRVAAAGRFMPSRINEVLVRRARRLSDEQLVARLRAHLTPSGLTAGFGGRIALTDGLIHRQDIRRPLGLGTDVPADRLSAALSFAMVAPPLRGAWQARGVRLRATDAPWTFGRGPEVFGPGEALLMTVAGRAVALSELDGPGLSRLRANLG